MSAYSVMPDAPSAQVWHRGSQSACMREAKRLEKEFSVRCWQIFCLDRRRGHWMLVL